MLHYIINLIIFIPITIILIIASIKLTKFNSDNINKHKYVKVLERTNLNKDTSIFVLGDEGCVLASSPSKTEKIKVLSKEEIAQIYDMKESYGIDLSQIDVDKFNISNFGLKNKKNKKNMFSKKNKSKFSNFNNSDRLLFNKK